MSNAADQDSRSETVGVVFATTGKTYNILARRAARTLKQCMPTVQIDWFTDATLKSDQVFSQIHRLSESFFRPKMEALRKSRFDHTLYLDADIITLSDVSELFTALDDFDLLAAHAEKGQVGILPEGEPPRCISALNSGVLAVRKSQATDAFLREWDREVREKGERRDQAAMRRVLARSRLRYSVLGPEYNLMKHVHLENWGQRLGSPRIIHAPALHEKPSGNPEAPFVLEEALSAELSAHVRKLVRHDRSLGAKHAWVLLTPRQKKERQLKSLQKQVKDLKSEKKRLAAELTTYRRSRSVRLLTRLNWRLRRNLDRQGPL